MISASDVQSIAASALRDALPCFSRSDTISASCALDRIRLDYVAARASCDSRDRTLVGLRFHPAQRLMWICDLRVATEFRSRGLGRRLRLAAEGVARRVGMETIHVLPLTSACPFWNRAGYRPHRRMTRVLAKHLNALKKSRDCALPADEALTGSSITRGHDSLLV